MIVASFHRWELSKSYLGEIESPLNY